MSTEEKPLIATFLYINVLQILCYDEPNMNI